MDGIFAHFLQGMHRNKHGDELSLFLLFSMGHAFTHLSTPFESYLLKFTFYDAKMQTRRKHDELSLEKI